MTSSDERYLRIPAIVDGPQAIAHVETRIFAERSERVIDANLDLVAAARDGVIDVTASIQGGNPCLPPDSNDGARELVEVA
jgi:hypothetical protein